MSNKFKKYLVYVIFLLGYELNAQERNDRHSIGIHWDLPTQIGGRYDFNFTNWLSGNIQVGILSEPNTSIILNTLEAFGTDQLTMDLIDNAFQFGFVMKEGVNIHFGKNYSGIYFQQIYLNGEDTPYDIVEVVLDEDLSQYPLLNRRRSGNETSLILDSNLFQFGILFGRRFHLKEEKSFLFAEIGASLNIGSNSRLSSEVRDFTNLNSEIDDYLEGIYSDYAFIPSLTFGWAKRF